MMCKEHILVKIIKVLAGDDMIYNEKNAEKTTELLSNGEDFFRKLLMIDG